MVFCCAVLNCKNRRKKRSSNAEDRKNDITFFSFPIKNSYILRQWIRNIGRKIFIPTSNSRICSEHFNKSDFKDTGLRRRLHKNAIPTRNVIFSQSLRSNANTRRKKTSSGARKKQALRGFKNDHSRYICPPEKTYCIQLDIRYIIQ